MDHLSIRSELPWPWSPRTTRWHVYMGFLLCSGHLEETGPLEVVCWIPTTTRSPSMTRLPLRGNSAKTLRRASSNTVLATRPFGQRILEPVSTLNTSPGTSSFIAGYNIQQTFLPVACWTTLDFELHAGTALLVCWLVRLRWIGLRDGLRLCYGRSQLGVSRSSMLAKFAMRLSQNDWRVMLRLLPLSPGLFHLCFRCFRKGATTRNPDQNGGLGDVRLGENEGPGDQGSYWAIPPKVREIQRSPAYLGSAL